MKRLTFRIECDGQPVAPGVLEREACPAIGETIQIFNYPVVERYRVKAWRIRRDAHAHDIHEPVALDLTRDTDLAVARLTTDDALGRPDQDLLRRLAVVGAVARRDLTEKLHLTLSNADFATLCDAAGLPGRSSFDALAFEGLPLSVDPVGADGNSYSAFGGFAGDLSCYWVTLPGGTPFVMNPGMLEVAIALAGHRMPMDKALAWCQMAARDNVVASRPALASAFADMLALIDEEIMPAYDGAQELTRIALPSEGPKVNARYATLCRQKGDPMAFANDEMPNFRPSA